MCGGFQCMACVSVWSANLWRVSACQCVACMWRESECGVLQYVTCVSVLRMSVCGMYQCITGVSV